MAGQQRVKLAGKEARELFLRSMSLVICMRRNLILFWTGNDKSIFAASFRISSSFVLTLSYSCAGPKSGLSSSEPFFSELFSIPSSRAISWQFLGCNFSAVSQVQFLGNFSGLEVGQKSPLLIPPAPISSPLTQLQPEAQTDFTQNADSTSERGNFFNRTISKIVNSSQKIFHKNIGIENWRRNYTRGLICECQYLLTPRKNMESLNLKWIKNISGIILWIIFCPRLYKYISFLCKVLYFVQGFMLRITA